MPSIIKVDQIQSDTGTVNQTSNLSFTGTGRRITGDFSNATISNRVAFQTSVADSSSIVNVLPNGTSGISSLRVYQNSDPNNASYGEILANGTDSIAIRSLRHGTGTYLPMTFVTGGSERLRIPADAGGITFPATQAASSDPNTLDDYEEGTFSPVLKLGDTTQTQTSGGPNARYVKIGRLVYFAIETYFSKSGTGEFNVSSLPFLAAATRQCHINYYYQFYTSSMPSTYMLTYIVSSGSSFTPQYMPSGGTQTAAINDTHFTGSTNYFYAAGTYMSAS
jgi:hypothetical protein